MDKLELIKTIRMELSALNLDIESALVKEIAGDIDLGHSGNLQFEIDPWCYRIHLVQTGNDVLESFSLKEETELTFEEKFDDVYEFVTDQIVEWFSERWLAIDGPIKYSPAYTYFHGAADNPRYDMEKGCWQSVQEIWPK